MIGQIGRMGGGMGMRRRWGGSPGPDSFLSLGGALFDGWETFDDGAIAVTGVTASAWASIRREMTAVQASLPARPTVSGRDVLFDGNDDELTAPGVGRLPIGAAECDLWWLGSQLADATDTATRVAATYGGTGSATYRSVGRRTVAGGVNAASAVVGSGAAGAGITTPNAPGDFSGLKLVRTVVTGGQAVTYLDGQAGAPVAVVPGTDGLRVRLGATTNPTPSAYAKMAMRAYVVTAHAGFGTPLEAQILALFNARRT